MSKTAEKTDPKLWETVKRKVTRDDKGGQPGQWSARKAQLAVHDYKAAGGGYKGKKSATNHLTQWTEEEWGTKSGHTSAETGERYLPKAVRDALTPDEYRRTTAKKRRDTAAGHQFSDQPRDVAAKASAAKALAAKSHAAKSQAAKAKAALRPNRSTAAAHHQDLDSKAALYERARAMDIKGRSRMTKTELEQAVSRDR